MSEFKTPKGTLLPLLDMRGKPYLQVAHRLVWFREEKPEHSIATSYVTVTETSAFAMAEVRDKDGRLLARAHKYEDKQGFGDFREKAETGAIGRALAMIGYGTQFCADDLNEGDRIVDSPALAGIPAHIGAKSPPHAGPSEAQLKRLFAIGNANFWKHEDIKSYLRDVYHIESTKELTRAQYDELCIAMETSKAGMRPEPGSSG